MIETDCARAEDSVMQDFSEMANVSTLNFNDRTQINRSSADDGIRTRDLRFTKPLLYQLSYVGGKRAKHCIRWRCEQAHEDRVMQARSGGLQSAAGRQLDIGPP